MLCHVNDGDRLQEADQALQLSHDYDVPAGSYHGTLAEASAAICGEAASTQAMREESPRSHASRKDRIAATGLKFMQQFNGASSLMRHMSGDQLLRRVDQLLAICRGEQVERLGVEDFSGSSAGEPPFPETAPPPSAAASESGTEAVASASPAAVHPPFAAAPYGGATNQHDGSGPVSLEALRDDRHPRGRPQIPHWRPEMLMDSRELRRRQACRFGSSGIPRRRRVVHG